MEKRTRGIVVESSAEAVMMRNEAEVRARLEERKRAIKIYHSQNRLEDARIIKMLADELRWALGGGGEG